LAQLNDLLVLGNTSLIGPIKANSDHDLLAHTNEFNFASPKFSGDICVNYRTASGKDGSINNYKFYKGDGSTLSNIYASTFYGALSGNATSSTTANYLSGWADTRSIATAPNDYNGVFKVVGIK
jgi:hypothetical protein